MYPRDWLTFLYIIANFLAHSAPKCKLSSIPVICETDISLLPLPHQSSGQNNES